MTQTELILKALDDGKAEDIVSKDISDKTSLADTLVIASGNSARHVFSLADTLEKKLKENGISARMDGKSGTGDWVIVDTGEVLVHLFQPETRIKYNLEELWGISKVS